jgi:carboxymethylenebutenolidase
MTMCDELTEGDLDRAGMPVSRRGFAGLVAAGSAALASGALAKSPKIKSAMVSIPTADGTADAWFSYPARGKHPAVLIWPDIRGLRPAFRQMADRLAGAGYAVLAINPFYRDAAGDVVKPEDDWTQPAIRERLFGYAGKLTPEAAGRDAVAVAAWFDKQKSVDKARGVGVTGYCLGGPLTIFSAAAVPERYLACGSFHGSRQSNDTPTSPHLAIARTKAQYLFAIAENDDARDPAEKDRLKAALAGRGGFNEVEVYAGAQHGWCPPDGRAYNAAAAEKAWGRMLALFAAAL